MNVPCLARLFLATFPIAPDFLPATSESVSVAVLSDSALSNRYVLSFLKVQIILVSELFVSRVFYVSFLLLECLPFPPDRMAVSIGMKGILVLSSVSLWIFVALASSAALLTFNLQFLPHRMNIYT